MSELAASVDYSANIVVVRTSPGAASYLASTIDRSGLDTIIGTVAGDDTVMLIARDPAGGASVCQELQELARA
jgi:transcriptional regulator of arginine metabolism